MKKIINGKKYDTETAKLIGRYRSELGRNDFRYFGEELFLKKTGEYFLFGEGHGMSKYRSFNGNSYSWGEEIAPMSKDEAFEWASKSSDMSVEQIEAHFGEVEE